MAVGCDCMAKSGGCLGNKRLWIGWERPNFVRVGVIVHVTSKSGRGLSLRLRGLSNKVAR